MYRRLAQHPCDIHIQNTGKTENNYKLEFFKLKTSTYQKAQRLRKQKNASHREGIQISEKGLVFCIYKEHHQKSEKKCNGQRLGKTLHKRE